MKTVTADIHKFKISTPDTKSVITDNTRQSLRFNVLSNKFVEETLIFNKYVVENSAIEVYFDRLYKTDMKKSPDHYIFLSALINLQKMIYLIMCKRFNVTYVPEESEKFKIWPLKTNIDMKGMVRDNINIMQDFHIDTFDKISDRKYYLEGKSSTHSTINIIGSAYIYLL